MSALLELAERVLALADGDAQVTVTRERSLDAVFAQSAPRRTAGADLLTVHVLALRDGHTGAASTTATDDEALAATARRAVAAADLAAAHGPGDHPGLPAPEPYRTHQGFDLATAQLDAAHAARQLRAAFDAAAAEGLKASGVWSVRELRTAIASTPGIRATDAVTQAAAKVVVRDDEGARGYASAAAVAARDLDLGALARQAAGTAGRGARAELDPGTYPVVLSEYALGELLGLLGGTAFNGLAHAEGRGALSGRLGTRVAAAAINLSDSPRFTGTLPRAFDAEGVPKSPVPLVQDGVAHRVVHDSRSAARAGGGARSTGHALEPGGAPDGPAPENLVLVGGGSADVEELARPIERGLYVHRLGRASVVDAQATLVTALTGEATSLIEDGAISGPVHDMQLTASVLGILDSVQALGARPRLVSASGFHGIRFGSGVVCPPVRVAGLRVARPEPYPPGP